MNSGVLAASPRAALSARAPSGAHLKRSGRRPPVRIAGTFAAPRGSLVAQPKIGHRGTEPGLDVRTAQTKPVLQRRIVWLDRLELTRCQRRRASVKGAAGGRQADAFKCDLSHG